MESPLAGTTIQVINRQICPLIIYAGTKSSHCMIAFAPAACRIYPIRFIKIRYLVMYGIAYLPIFRSSLSIQFIV
jgi:hypothetical protein